MGEGPIVRSESPGECFSFVLQSFSGSIFGHPSGLTTWLFMDPGFGVTLDRALTFKNSFVKLVKSVIKTLGTRTKSSFGSIS